MTTLKSYVDLKLKIKKLQEDLKTMEKDLLDSQLFKTNKSVIDGNIKVTRTVRQNFKLSDAADIESLKEKYPAAVDEATTISKTKFAKLIYNLEQDVVENTQTIYLTMKEAKASELDLPF